MLRPIHSTSCRSLIAFVSSCSLARSTNPNPRFRPDSRSRGSEHFVTSPYCPNRWVRSSLSVSQERLPIKMVKEANQKGASLTIAHRGPPFPVKGLPAPGPAAARGGEGVRSLADVLLRHGTSAPCWKARDPLSWLIGSVLHVVNWCSCLS